MFLPANYKKPQASSADGYMRLQDGLNKLRILSDAITGYEYWNVEGKPVRLREFPNEFPEDIRKDKDGKPEKIKHFWAFIVWNYDLKKVQILEVTQATIRDGILALVNDEEWGDVKQYDLKITRTGEGIDTKYAVGTSIPKELSLEVANAFAEKKINLEALYEGLNPFEDNSYDGDKEEEEIDLANFPV